MVQSPSWNISPDSDDVDIVSAREEALKAAVVATDEDFCTRLTSHGLTTSSGSTAIIAYIEQDNLIVANVGGNSFFYIFFFQLLL